ncbi:hypothetical protein K6H09_003603 [Candida tropicalis]
MLPKEFEALNKSYNEFYNDSYNLVQEYKDNGFVDVADKLIVITLNLKLRLYNRVLEPYSYDPEMVEYQLCDKRELEVVRSLFKEIIKRNAYFKLVKERCHKLMPPDLVSETTSTAERSNSYVPVVSIENSSEYTELADVEFSDEFDDQSSDIYPTEPKIYSISEIKQVPMSLDEEVYPISGKVYATFPDDWSFIAGKVGKGDVISIRDLELIVGNVNINEDTILDDRNSLSIILQRDELLKYTKKEFLFRSRVRSTYRELARQIYKTHERQDLMSFLRDEFKVNSNQTDLQYRKYLLSQALTKINQMSASLGITLKR